MLFRSLALELTDMLRNLDLPTYTLGATMSQTDRAAQVSAFQANAGPACIVSALAVGGVAISLDTADLNVFVELDWIPATVYQASMRTFRPDRPQANVFLVADVDVERRLVEVLACNEACQSALGLGYDEVATKVMERMGA